MSKETKALNKISQALGGEAKVQKNDILEEIASNVDGGGSGGGGSTGLNNLVDGAASGSVRGVNTTSEGGSYHLGSSAFTEGYQTKAYGNYSHAEGRLTEANNMGAHAEGQETAASGNYSHAEGQETAASGNYSHAEGGETIASGIASHTEGSSAKATATASHAEGSQTTASGSSSHAEGSHTTASGLASHAEGHDTISNHAYQHVFGEYNVADASSVVGTSRGTYVEIVGSGTGNNNRSNARTLDWSGNESLSGGLTLGMGTTDEVTLTAAQLKQLLALLS